MKTKITLSLSLILVLLFANACKNPELETDSFKIENEKIQQDSNVFVFSGTYDFPVDIDGLKLFIDEANTMVNATGYKATLDGNSFSVRVNGLNPGKTYYYRYFIEYEKTKNFFTEINHFETQSQKPSVKINEVLTIDSTAIRIKCEVLADGGADITGRGICWNTYGDPNIDDNVVSSNTLGVGEYNCNLAGLNPATQYFIRAYAKNSVGISYSDEFTYATDNSLLLPTVTTLDISNITATSVTCHGMISSDGGTNLINCGACWSEHPEPTIEDHYILLESVGIGDFNVIINDLLPNHTYYVRAFATNDKGTAYGDDLPVTLTAGLATVSTNYISNITSKSSTCNGTVTDQGLSNVTERGFYWSTNSNPNSTNTPHQCGSGIGDFSFNLTDLTPGTTYYVQAYAINSQGEAKGEVRSFTTTTDKPTLSLVRIFDISSNSAKCEVNVTDSGGEEVNDRGVCWSTHPEPTLDDYSVSNGTGTGVFFSTIIGLTPGTHYYVRAYATNGQGTSYSEEEMPLYTEQSLPTVVTAPVTNITITDALGGGEVTSDGGAPVVERGICWGTNPNPTTDDLHVSGGEGLGAYELNIPSLSPNMTYYVRAYAINSIGTNYGTDVTFTTLNTSWDNGMLPGVFSVSATKRVQFSQGNLQYQASSNTWRFAEHQYECLKETNNNISQTNSNWIDLFGWGTSGYNHGAVCYQPWSTSQEKSDYYAYGASNNNLYDQTGKAEWGYNAISNGGNQENSGWRTLTMFEFVYLFNQRQTPSGIRYAKGNVNDMNGVILLPNDWSASNYNLSSTNIPSAPFSSNIISLTDWLNVLEPAGAVFLPAAGDRVGDVTYEYDEHGFYWGSEYYSQYICINLYFNNNEISPDGGNFRHGGFSVRLVKDSTK